VIPSLTPGSKPHAPQLAAIDSRPNLLAPLHRCAPPLMLHRVVRSRVLHDLDPKGGSEIQGDDGQRRLRSRMRRCGKDAGGVGRMRAVPPSCRGRGRLRGRHRARSWPRGSLAPPKAWPQRPACPVSTASAPPPCNSPPPTPRGGASMARKS
jgi:hypothetical protein